MRSSWLLVLPVVLFGCGPSAADKAKMKEVKAYLAKVVAAENKYQSVNQTFSLNISELYHFDESLETPPAGYKITGGGGLALAFGYAVHATPIAGLGPHLFVNTSGVIRYRMNAQADEDSAPVE